MKANPKIAEFKKEVTKLNNLLAEHQIVFCKRLTIIQDLCQLSDSLVDQLSDMRTYYREVEKNISNFIAWQEKSEGQSTNHHKIEESQKDIVFQEWEIKLKHAEIMIYSSRDISINIIKSINDSLLQANIISDCLEDTLPDVKLLTKTWEESSKKKAEGINSLTNIYLEFHWRFLVKPHR